MAHEPPPFTLTGWMLNRATDHAEAVYVYLDKLKRAKDMQGRMLVHTEFLKMRMEKYNGHIKTAGDALQLTQTIVGAVVSIFRHKENIEEMAQRNEQPTLAAKEETLAAAGYPILHTKKLTTKQIRAIEKLLADK